MQCPPGSGPDASRRRRLAGGGPGGHVLLQGGDGEEGGRFSCLQRLRRRVPFRCGVAGFVCRARVATTTEAMQKLSPPEARVCPDLPLCEVQCRRPFRQTPQWPGQKALLRIRRGIFA